MITYRQLALDLGSSKPIVSSYDTSFKMRLGAWEAAIEILAGKLASRDPCFDQDVFRKLAGHKGREESAI